MPERRQQVVAPTLWRTISDPCQSVWKSVVVQAMRQESEVLEDKPSSQFLHLHRRQEMEIVARWCAKSFVAVSACQSLSIGPLQLSVVVTIIEACCQVQTSALVAECEGSTSGGSPFRPSASYCRPMTVPHTTRFARVCARVCALPVWPSPGLQPRPAVRSRAICP